MSESRKTAPSLDLLVEDAVVHSFPLTPGDRVQFGFSERGFTDPRAGDADATGFIVSVDD